MADLTRREIIATALLSTALATLVVHAMFAVPGIVQMSIVLHRLVARDVLLASPIPWLPVASIAVLAVVLIVLTVRGQFATPMKHSAAFLALLGIVLALTLLLPHVIAGLLKSIAPHAVLWLPPFETLAEIALVGLVVYGYKRATLPCVEPARRLWVPVLAFFTAFWAMMPTLAWLKTQGQ